MKVRILWIELKNVSAETKKCFGVVHIINIRSKPSKSCQIIQFLFSNVRPKSWICHENKNRAKQWAESKDLTSHSFVFGSDNAVKYRNTTVASESFQAQTLKSRDQIQGEKNRIEEIKKELRTTNILLGDGDTPYTTVSKNALKKKMTNKI